MASLALAGCAASSSAPPAANAATAGAEPTAGALARLAQASEAQERRVAELEARLSLLEQESRGSRAQPVASFKPVESVHIGAPRRERLPHIESEATEVPVVRLHEAAPEFVEPLSLPAPPLGVNAKLGVVPLPGERAAKAVADQTVPGTARDRYRAALGLVRERRWDDAERVLSALLAEQPASELNVSAMYWRAEVYYAQRRYREALAEFESVLSRAVPSTKTANSLLKVGLCHLRLGDQSTAQRYFRQVIEQYPTSDAARIASREGSS